MQQFLENNLGLSPVLQYKIIVSILIIIVFLIIQRLLKKLLIHRIGDLKVRYQWQKISLYLAVFLIIISLSNIWLELFGLMGTFLGLLSAGIAIALKDPLVNMVA